MLKLFNTDSFSCLVEMVFLIFQINCDIIDSGNSMTYLLSELEKMEPANIKIASLLYKPDAFKGNYPIHYIGFTIPNDFIVGYGLDYNGYGRNLKEIYTLVK